MSSTSSPAAWNSSTSSGTSAAVGIGASVPDAPGAEQPDGAADLGEALPPEPLGREERLLGLVRVPPHREARAGHVQHGHRQGVRDDVVDLAGDALALLGDHRLLGQRRLGRLEVGVEREL